MVADLSNAFTSAEAARSLGVSERQVRRLLDAGRLVGAGSVGRSVLIDAASVHRMSNTGARIGRPWAEMTCWAAIELLADGKTKRLTDSQRSHLRARLRTMGALELLRSTQRRAVVHRYRGSESFLVGLRGRVELTGRSAIAGSRSLASHFGLAGGRSRTVDGYVLHSDMDRLVQACFLTFDTTGNVTLRATQSSATWTQNLRVITTALDLADSLDTRERSAGLAVLGEALDGR